MLRHALLCGMEVEKARLGTAQDPRGGTRLRQGRRSQATRPGAPGEAHRLVWSLGLPYGYRRAIQGVRRPHRLARDLVGRPAVVERAKIFSMVKGTKGPTIFCHLGLAGALALSQLSALGEPLADYQIGDSAKEDVVTPVPL